MSDFRDDFKDIKVLVVDDEVSTLNLVKRMLLDLGITNVFTSTYRVEALQLLDTFDGEDFVNLVMCDWNMPRMSGIEMLKQVRSCDPDMPFLMITGLADVDSVIEAKAYSVTGYIKKPFSLDELRKKLRIVSRMMKARENSGA